MMKEVNKFLCMLILVHLSDLKENCEHLSVLNQEFKNCMSAGG